MNPADVVALPSTVQVVRHDRSVEGVSFSPDSPLLVTTGDDKTARV
jgi:hypothetical protein